MVLHASLTPSGASARSRSRRRASFSSDGRARGLGRVVRQELEQLQLSQDANVADGANLSLERVDYSTRENLILNLPKRVRDVIFRPYLWQTQNPSQQLGALGTSSCSRASRCWPRRSPATAIDHAAAGPLVYPAAFMLVAYAISAGNAGTAYRYRTHLVAMAVCLRHRPARPRRQEQEGPARVPTRPGLGPVSRTRTAT